MTNTPLPSRSSAYAKKLNDPRWLRKKADIMIRDGNRCRFCKSETGMLQVRFVVHRGIDPWEYPDDELQTVCVFCAEIRTNVFDDLIARLRLSLKDTPNDRLSVVAENMIRSITTATIS